MSAHRKARKAPSAWRERILIGGSVLIVGGLFALALQAIELAVVVALLGLGIVVVAVFA